MPTKTVRTRAHARTAPSPAAALIAKAKNPKTVEDVGSGGIEALRELIAHNDSISRSDSSRVSADAATKMLRDHFGWSGNSRCALNSLCRRLFGRTSWGTP